MEISALDHGCYFLWPGKKISKVSKIELITKLEIVKKKRKTARSKQADFDGPVECSELLQLQPPWTSLL